MKTILTLLLCLLLPAMAFGEPTAVPPMATAAPTPAPTAVPVEVACAHYTLRASHPFVSEEATLRVYSNGTSEMTLQFKYATGQSVHLHDEPIIRLIKVDGEEGFYGQASLVVTGEPRNANARFFAVMTMDRAFGKTGFLTFSVCDPDGTELRQMKYELADYDTPGGSWPSPEATPEVPTIPPIIPTATPTMRPTLPPDATVPPQEAAILTIPYKLREITANFTEVDATLRIYEEELSTLTLRFKYSKDIAEGTVLRLTRVDGRIGYFGEGLVSPADENGVRETVILFNQQVGPMRNINLEAFAPGAQVRQFKAFYKPAGNTPSAWAEMDPIATIVPDPTGTPAPLPEGASPTPAPTAPEGKPTSRTYYSLLDPVKRFSLRNACHERYEGGLSVLTIQFRYTGELPAKPLIRITQKEYTEGNFGEAIAQWDKKDSNLLTATIVTDQLQGGLRAFRLKCYDERGNELFYADLYPEGTGAYVVTSARSMMPTATPEPSDTPAPTPTMAPTPDPETSPTPAPTEPDYSQARHKRKFLLLDKVKGFSLYNATLRRYAEVDVLSVYFRWKDLPEGTVLRLVRADTLLDSFGEAPVLPAELKDASKDLLCAKIPSDRIPLNCIGLRVEAVTPEGEVLFTADLYTDEGNQAKTARALLTCEFEDAGDEDGAQAQ